MPPLLPKRWRDLPPIPGIPGALFQVVHVDLTLHPPSYGVELPGGGFRETEAARLRPLGEAPVSAKAAAGGAGVLPVQAVNGHASLKQQAAIPAAAAAGLAHAVQEEDGDDAFGDFFAAPPAPPAAPAALRVPTPAVAAVPAPVGSPRPSLLSTATGSPQSRGSGKLRGGYGRYAQLPPCIQHASNVCALHLHPTVCMLWLLLQAPSTCVACAQAFFEGLFEGLAELWCPAACHCRAPLPGCAQLPHLPARCSCRCCRRDGC